MKNNFTYENTKGATHVRLYPAGQIEFFNINSDTYLGGKMEKFEPCWIPSDGRTRAKHIASHPEHYINLTDQTGRGYPTLKWFLEQGGKLKVGDTVKSPAGKEFTIEDDRNGREWLSTTPSSYDDKAYVKSLHDNRHDLTAIARDEYYSKRGKQWPNNERIDAIGQNGNNGEHYPHESESPLSPNFEIKQVYMQEVMLSPSVGWVKAVVTHKGNRFTTFQVESGREYARKNSKLKIRELDTRTDEEKLRDAMYHVVSGCVSIESAIEWLMQSNKFTITLNEEG